MYKIILLLFVSLMIYLEFSYLLRNTATTHSRTQGISIKHLDISQQEKNTTLLPLFARSHWLLTPADKQVAKAKTNILSDDNASEELQIIVQKSSTALCKGTSCMTIKGLIGKKLLLEHDNNITAVKPSEKIFGIIELKKISGTTLYFENTETNDTYKLQFFTYKLTKENNNTNIKSKR